MTAIYDFFTWIWYRVFHFPIRLRKVYDNKRKKPLITAVFLHGISATSYTWRYTFKQFQEDSELADVRFVALDLLGFGKSLRANWLDYDEMDYCTALHNSLRSLRTKKSVIVLVGHSMGSLISADYATNYQSARELAGMILVSPPLLMADELAKLPDKVYTKSYRSLHKFASEVPAAEVIAKIIQRFSSFKSSYLKTTAFEKSMNNIILNRKNYTTFTKIRIPTLIVHGHFDPLVMSSNLKRAAKRNPNYLRYTSVIGHHDISIGKRAKIANELKRILREERKNETI